MQFQSPRRHRRSIRLREYDYTEAGAYFVTICTYSRERLFGDVIDGEMHLDQWGDVVRDEWLRTAVLKPSVQLDALVVMPNHIPGVSWIRGERARHAVPLRSDDLELRLPGRWERSWVLSNPPVRDASTRLVTLRPCRCGNAITSSMSFGTKPNYCESANTLPLIPFDGQKTSTILNAV
jgi:hypothetical protein